MTISIAGHSLYLGVNNMSDRIDHAMAEMAEESCWGDGTKSIEEMRAEPVCSIPPMPKKRFVEAGRDESLGSSWLEIGDVFIVVRVDNPYDQMNRVFQKPMVYGDGSFSFQKTP